MRGYCLVRVWELRPGCSAAELEVLAASGVVEIQRWLPGVERLSLVRLGGQPGRYVFIITFTNYESYIGWRRVEEEGPDYWEHYASVRIHWEQLSRMVEECAGEVVLDAVIDQANR